MSFCSVAFFAQGCNVHPLKNSNGETVNKIEMKLSAFGVEVDGFPNINVILDLKNDTSYCDVSYYDPKFPAKICRLKKGEIDRIRYLISQYDLRKLKSKYTVLKTDQPTSTAIFYLTNETIKVTDYGLKGQSPLSELYELVYNLDENFRSSNN